ncbi:MAG: hypothetical protein IKS72_02890, partial [Prevotella sp.]|nr:hypothetical protein [Prevotella sp.]
MKKRFSILFLVATSLFLPSFVATVKAQKKIVVDGIGYQVNVKKESAIVVKKAEPYMGDIVIPERVMVD